MKRLCITTLLACHLLIVNSNSVGQDGLNNYGKLTEKENEQLQRTCGRPGPTNVQKSVNGERTVRRNAPWVVAVSVEDYYVRDSNRTISSCSGVLISPRHVLSARHCLLAPSPNVFYRTYLDNGEYPEDTPRAVVNEKQMVFIPELVNLEGVTLLKEFRFVFDDDCSADIIFNEGQPCTAEGAIIRRAIKDLEAIINNTSLLHKRFNQMSFSPNVYVKDFKQGRSDIIIFELDEPVPLGPELYPACLAEKLPAVKDVLELYGYGLDYINDNTSVAGALQHISVTTVPCLVLNSPDVMCVRSDTQISGGGDSGGGYVYTKNGTTFVTSLVSGEAEVSDNYRDDAQTSVAPHLAWICEHVGICRDSKVTQVHPEIERVTIS